MTFKNTPPSCKIEKNTLLALKQLPPITTPTEIAGALCDIESSHGERRGKVVRHLLDTRYQLRLITLRYRHLLYPVDSAVDKDRIGPVSGDVGQK